MTERGCIYTVTLKAEMIMTECAEAVMTERGSILTVTLKAATTMRECGSSYDRMWKQIYRLFEG